MGSCSSSIKTEFEIEITKEVIPFLGKTWFIRKGKREFFYNIFEK